MNILNATQKMIVDFAHEEEGAQIVEYGMIIGAISLVLIGALAALKDGDFSGLLGKINNCLKGDPACR